MLHMHSSFFQNTPTWLQTQIGNFKEREEKNEDADDFDSGSCSDDVI